MATVMRAANPALQLYQPLIRVSTILPTSPIPAWLGMFDRSHHQTVERLGMGHEDNVTRAIRRVNESASVKFRLSALEAMPTDPYGAVAAPCATDSRPLLRLRQVLVRAVAERRVRGVLALAPPDGFFLRHLVFHRLQAGALVRAVAKRRVARAAAGTPPMGAGLHFERQRLGIANNRLFSHGFEKLAGN